MYILTLGLKHYCNNNCLYVLELHHDDVIKYVCISIQVECVSD